MRHIVLDDVRIDDAEAGWRVSRFETELGGAEEGLKTELSKSPFSVGVLCPIAHNARLTPSEAIRCCHKLLHHLCQGGAQRNKSCDQGCRREVDLRGIRHGCKGDGTNIRGDFVLSQPPQDPDDESA
jgi:hypothetical protein